MSAEYERESAVISIVKEAWGTSVTYDPDPAAGDNLRETTCSVPKILPNVLSRETEPAIERKSSFNVEVIEEPKYKLPFFFASMFGAILEDVIIQLRILVECNTEMRVTKTMADKGLLLALKYGVEQKKVVNELDGVDAKNLDCDQYKLNKLDADRKYAIEVMTSTYKDLNVKWEYEPLVTATDSIVERDNYRAFLAEVEAKNKSIRRDLHKQLRQQRNHFTSVKYDTDVTIDKLRTEVEDSSLNSEIRSRYVEKWQVARTEQHLQTIGDIEKTPSENIEYYKLRSEHEQRAHSEIELLTNIMINETLETVEQWMEKYDRDMEKIDLKIQIKKNEYQNQLDDRIALEEKIEAHDIEINEWEDFKDKREKARQYREKMTKSAIIVQAWWRGLLVRKQLGPYKKVKKKKEKDKKN